MTKNRLLAVTALSLLRSPRNRAETIRNTGNRSMSMTDPIADMLTRIRNACGSKHRRVDIPASKLKAEIARILLENNYIKDVKTVAAEDGRPVLRLYLKYAQGGD